ncbi:SRPBCC family protein [Protaetiibacter intestinalis]|uniref:SRPBCC domain-containing protein n=1 Tax=Protaetiibacter intestinalis TaxID=2419774 RepID=A0A387BAE5_9MICO|nr:hypothetical protein [Protaetiibacter intestinalis]AYF98871.1 hypothetical protein D7I47_11815 [Protaetiibacter intestinalis]
MDELRAERSIPLPRGIVWEALVDPVLVEGWLHPAERLVSGTTPVRFEEPETPAAPAVLQVVSPAFGDVTIELAGALGGPRGESTVLRLTVVDAWGRLSEREALWSLRLDQLEDLLHGHPVDWATWSTRHHAEDAAARAELGRRRAR